MYQLDINKGDIILRGKYRNKKEVVKTFGHDDKGQPTINGKRILNFNIEKLLPKKEVKETMKKSELKELIQECILEEARLNPKKVNKLLDDAITAVNKFANEIYVSSGDYENESLRKMYKLSYLLDLLSWWSYNCWKWKN